MGYLDGFGVTLKKWVGVNTDTGRRVTTEYPEEVRPKPERFHGRHVLNRYEDGMEKCIGCELCAGVCPARCIYVRGQDNDPDDPTSPGERFGYVYEINYLRCIHCDLCVEACPTEAITETKMFEFAFTNRADGIYTKDELLVDDEGRPRQLPYENWDGGFDAARDTSGWMRSTAPNGDAAFVGIVAWAGELGYGVRAPERDPDAPVASAALATEDDHAPSGSAHDEAAREDEPTLDERADVHAPSDHAPGSFDLGGGSTSAASPSPTPAAQTPAEPSDPGSPEAAPADRSRDGVATIGPGTPAEFDATGGSRPAAPEPGSQPEPAAEPEPAATPEEASSTAEPDEPQPPARGPGMFDAVDADEPPPAGPKPGRWRRGKGDR